MPYVMQVLAGNYINELTQDFEPATYVRHYDIEFNNGDGIVETTPDLNFAMRWDNIGDLLTAWRKVSVTKPRRDDGALNRPLTALSIIPVEVPE
jgi:hypothetical protein